MRSDWCWAINLHASFLTINKSIAQVSFRYFFLLKKNKTKKSKYTFFQRSSLTNSFQHKASSFISVLASVSLHVLRVLHVPHFLENLACLCLGGAHFRHNVSTVERREEKGTRSLQDSVLQRHVETPTRQIQERKRSGEREDKLGFSTEHQILLLHFSLLGQKKVYSFKTLYNLYTSNAQCV